MPSRKQQKGITLIELMVVVAVVAILGGVALPSYLSYVQRGKTQEATSALADARVKFEQYFQDNRTYEAYVSASCSPIIAGTKYFTYACTNMTATTYTITATGSVGEGMSGYVYTINQANAKTSTIGGTTVNCWVTKKGEAC